MRQVRFAVVNFAVGNFAEPPGVRVPPARQSTQCVLLVSEKFAEKLEFRVGNFAVNLKRKISHAKLKCHGNPPPPYCNNVLHQEWLAAKPKHGSDNHVTNPGVLQLWVSSGTDIPFSPNQMCSLHIHIHAPPKSTHSWEAHLQKTEPRAGNHKHQLVNLLDPYAPPHTLSLSLIVEEDGVYYITI